MEDVIRIKDQFYVLATSSFADDRTRVLKYGETFAIFNRFGDVESAGVGEQGIYYKGTRYLSRLALRLGSDSPQILRSTVQDDNAFLTVDMMNHDIYKNDRLDVERGSVHVFRSKFLWKDVSYEKFRVANYSLNVVESSVSLEFDADFADIFQVRGLKREHAGAVLPPEVQDGTVLLLYRGRDQILRRTRLHFDPAPERLTGSSAIFPFSIRPKEEASFSITVSCEEEKDHAKTSSFDHALHETRRTLEHARLRHCHLSTSNRRFSSWIERCDADLQMMINGNPEGAYPYAGVPWFNTVFGRDGILTAMECLWTNPWIAKSVLKFLAETQATELNPPEDAEPGKILHEMRHGEMANLKEVPFGRYYGAVDTTPLFVMLAGAYLDRTDDKDFVRAIWPNVLAALDWIDTYGDPDHDGFVEYQAKSRKGLVQQGWKDSHDSISHRDGTLAQAPIALCEVQGYVYGARLAAARIAAEFGQEDLSQKLRAKASEIQRKFERDFWDEELNSYVLALDGSKQPCRVRSSNPGHCLFTKVASPEHAGRLAGSLLGAEMFCGWGIRTLGSAEVRYNPMSYHNGSVWPHDNAVVAQGLASYGFRKECLSILTGLFEAAHFMELCRLPELFCGFHRRSGTEGPTLYPVACSPQSWAAGSVYMFLQACLGLEFEPKETTLKFNSPCLPDFIPDLRIENLRIQDAELDLVVRNDGQRVFVDVSRNDGGASVAVLQ